MGKVIWLPPAGPDDPIYREGLKIFTPRPARGAPMLASIKAPAKPAKTEDEV